MAWFGRRTGRDTSRPALSRGFGGARLGAWPAGYEAQVAAGYAGNAVAQRAVKLLAESVGGAPLSCSDAGLHALLSGDRVLETIAAQLLLHGNAFVQLLRDGDGAAAALFPLRPERVAVEPGADGWPAAHRYRVGERCTQLATEAVIHVRAYHPTDDHYGMGCLGAASAQRRRWARRASAIASASRESVRLGRRS